MNDQTPRETPNGGSWPHRAPGEILTAAEQAGLVRPAADVRPFQRPGAGLLLRVLGGLYAWQGPPRCIPAEVSGDVQAAPTDGPCPPRPPAPPSPLARAAGSVPRRGARSTGA